MVIHQRIIIALAGEFSLAKTKCAEVSDMTAAKSWRNSTLLQPSSKNEYEHSPWGSVAD